MQQRLFEDRSTSPAAERVSGCPALRFFGQGNYSVLGAPYACAVRMPYACPESARGRSWPPWRQGRWCHRPVRQHDVDHHQPRTTTCSQGGARADLAWRRGRAVEDLGHDRSARRRSYSTSGAARCRASWWRRLMATDRWWPVRSSGLCTGGGSGLPPGRKVPAGACAGGSRLTPGGGQVMPRARRQLDALSAAWLPISRRASLPRRRVGLLPPRRGAAVARERRRPVGGTSGAEPLP